MAKQKPAGPEWVGLRATTVLISSGDLDRRLTANALFYGPFLARRRRVRRPPQPGHLRQGPRHQGDWRPGKPKEVAEKKNGVSNPSPDLRVTVRGEAAICAVECIWLRAQWAARPYTGSPYRL